METPEGKSMRAVPFTVQFITWFDEDKFPSHVPYEVLETMCKQGLLELIQVRIDELNKGWSSVYLDVEQKAVVA
jgi:hypothetical protein